MRNTIINSNVAYGIRKSGSNQILTSSVSLNNLSSAYNPFLVTIDNQGNCILNWPNANGSSNRRSWIQNPKPTRIGFVTFVGEAGSGKTVLIPKLLKDLRSFKNSARSIPQSGSLENLSNHCTGITMSQVPAVMGLPDSEENTQTDVYALNLDCNPGEKKFFPKLLQYSIKISSAVVFVVDESSAKMISKSLQNMRNAHHGSSVALIVFRFWPARRKAGGVFASNFIHATDFLDEANRNHAFTADATIFAEEVIQVFWNVYVSFPRAPDMNDIEPPHKNGSKTGHWAKFLHRPFNSGLEVAHYDNIDKLLEAAFNDNSTCKSGALTCQSVTDLSVRDYVTEAPPPVYRRFNSVPRPDRTTSEKRRSYLSDMLSAPTIQESTDSEMNAASPSWNAPSQGSVSSDVPDDSSTSTYASTEWSFVNGSRHSAILAPPPPPPKPPRLVLRRYENSSTSSPFLDSSRLSSSPKVVRDRNQTELKKAPFQNESSSSAKIHNQAIVNDKLELEFLKLELQTSVYLMQEPFTNADFRQHVLGSEANHTVGSREANPIDNRKMATLREDLVSLVAIVQDFRQLLERELLEKRFNDGKRLEYLRKLMDGNMASYVPKLASEAGRLKSILASTLSRTFYSFHEKSHLLRYMPTSSKV